MRDQIFISYRRNDAAYVTGHINDLLRHEFGDEAVFTDVDNIALGVDFRAVLDETVSQCQVLLAVIGSEWVSAKDGDGQLRLHDPADFVRIEIESALNRNIPVIPLLVSGATMPAAEDLPESMHGLVFRNGTQIRPAPDFSVDMARLIKNLRRHFDSTRESDSASTTPTNAESDRKPVDQPPPAEVDAPRDSQSSENDTGEVGMMVADDERVRKSAELGMQQSAAPKRRAAGRWLIAAVVVAGASWYFANQNPENVQSLLDTVQSTVTGTEQNLDSTDETGVEQIGSTNNAVEEETVAVTNTLDTSLETVAAEPAVDLSISDSAGDAAESIPEPGQATPENTLANAVPEEVVDESAIIAEPVVQSTSETVDEPETTGTDGTDAAEEGLSVEIVAVDESVDNAAPSVAEDTDEASASTVDDEIVMTPGTQRQSDSSNLISEGVRLAGVGDHEAAIPNFSAAIELDVEPGFAYKQRAASYRAIGQHDAAVQDYSEAIELNGEDVNAYYSRGASYNALQDYSSAIADYDAVIELDPEFVDAYSRRAGRT